MEASKPNACLRLSTLGAVLEAWEDTSTTQDGKADTGTGKAATETGDRSLRKGKL